MIGGCTAWRWKGFPGWYGKESREATVALDMYLSAKVLSRYLSLAAHAVIPKVYVDRKRPNSMLSRASGGLLLDGLERIVFFCHLSVLPCATR